MLKKTFAKHIWTFEQKQRFMGLEIGTRMTVVDLSGHGDLWVHSPIHLSHGLQKELKMLGKVQFIVAPNKLHHLYVKEYVKLYPQAKLYVAPGLEEKRKDLKNAIVIEPDEDYAWSTAIDYMICNGVPLFNEVVFLHKESETLIITDIGLHICKESAPLTKLMFWLVGGYGKFGISGIEKKIFIKDRKKFQKTMEKIAKWDFNKIIMAHGRLISENGKKAFRKAYLK